MNPFFLWLESTALSVWIRESTSVFAYPAILSAHAIGMGLAAGINAALALRLLGVGPDILASDLKPFVPAMWLGFWLNAVSGVALLIAYPTKALTNPLFYVKLSLIAAGIWTFTLIRRRIFRDPVSLPVSSHSSASRGLTLLAVASPVCWAGAITSGRLLAYTYTRLFASW